MKKSFFSLILSLILVFEVFSIAGNAEKADTALPEILPNTWAATDGLGRTLTLNTPKRENKFVGMFYWIWHYPWCANYSAINTTQILEKNPDAKYDFNHPAWGNYQDGVPQFWDEPLFGYYSDLDEYVLRKHAELLADADIDVVIFDSTNGTETFKDGYETLFKVWEEAKKDGVDVPQIAFMLNFFDKDEIRTQILQLYNDVYSKGRYEDLWFMWSGKPLVMGNGNALDKKNATDKAAFDFFTFRKNEPTYFCVDKPLKSDIWGWCSSYPQTLFGKYYKGFKKHSEQVCVSVAQNANENGLCAMNSADGTVQGRNYANGNYSYSYEYKNQKVVVDKNTDNLLFYGLNFQQQWDYALAVDPDFVFVTGFNEWIAGRFKEWYGTPNASPDQYSPEFSRDIEPSNGVLKDYYYYQLCENVRRYKGTGALPETKANKTIDINSSASQWNDVLPEYNHYTGSTRERDFNGWKGLHYENHTMRNDIVKSKVAYDENNIYFYVETADTLSAPTDNGWMRLFIDTDTSGISDNWESFEYVINRTSPENGTVTVEKSTGGWNFEKVGNGKIAVNDNYIQLQIPRNTLGFENAENIKFNFKWSDNMQSDGDVMDFYQNGDVAPGGRFTFVFDSSADGNCEKDNIKRSFDFLTSLKIFWLKLKNNIKNWF